MIIAAFLVLAFGLVFGSFFNVLIFRLPGDLGLKGDRSVCPKCKTVLRPIDLIPVLSWLMLRGRCRYCKAEISVQYPLVEIVSAIFALVAFLRHSLSLEAFLLYAFMSSCLIIALTDLRTRIIPDAITLPLLALFIIAAPFRGRQLLPSVPVPGAENWIASLLNAVLGALICGGFLYLLSLLKDGGMGGGDIKFVAASGAYLGWYTTVLLLLLGSVLGLIAAFILLKTKKMNRGDPVAFGPYLAAAGLILSNVPIDRLILGLGM